jgi:hypothetical protein
MVTAKSIINVLQFSSLNVNVVAYQHGKWNLEDQGFERPKNQWLINESLILFLYDLIFIFVSSRRGVKTKKQAWDRNFFSKFFGKQTLMFDSFLKYDVTERHAPILFQVMNLPRSLFFYLEFSSDRLKWQNEVKKDFHLHERK